MFFVCFKLSGDLDVHTYDDDRFYITICNDLDKYFGYAKPYKTLKGAKIAASHYLKNFDDRLTVELEIEELKQ